MKSHGSSLWITGPRLALAPWWTRDHEAAWPLRSSGGHHDSSERERERGRRSCHQWCHLEAELQRWPLDCAQQRRPMVLQFDGEMVLSVRRGDWRGVGAMDNVGALVVPFIGS
jgi:hypothetical protein